MSGVPVRAIARFFESLIIPSLAIHPLTIHVYGKRWSINNFALQRRLDLAVGSTLVIVVVHVLLTLKDGTGD